VQGLVEVQVDERAVLCALKCLADVDALSLAGVGPRVKEQRPVLVEAADLQAPAHGDSALGVVLQVTPVEAAESKSRLNVPDRAKAGEIGHLWT
jgi:hypothetical protein